MAAFQLVFERLVHAVAVAAGAVVLHEAGLNRIGGQVGHIGKLYMDSSSLKLYDESELDIWMKDAVISGSKRDLKEKENPNRGISDQYQKRNK